MTTKTREFRFKGWDLLDAIDALLAFDGGALDSGTSDPDLRAAVLSHLRQMDVAPRQKLLAQYARRFLTDEAIREGYGLNDVAKFIEWLSEANISIL